MLEYQKKVDAEKVMNERQKFELLRQQVADSAHFSMQDKIKTELT